VHFLPFWVLISEIKLPWPMTALDLHRPNTIFAILQGLKTTMNSQAKPSQAKPSQAKPSQAAAQCLPLRDLSETSSRKLEPP